MTKTKIRKRTLAPDDRTSAQKINFICNTICKTICAGSIPDVYDIYLTAQPYVVAGLMIVLKALCFNATGIFTHYPGYFLPLLAPPETRWETARVKAHSDGCTSNRSFISVALAAQLDGEYKKLVYVLIDNMPTLMLQLLNPITEMCGACYNQTCSHARKCSQQALPENVANFLGGYIFGEPHTQKCSRA